MSITLTADERETCAKFEALLKRLVVGPVTSVSAGRIALYGDGFFTSDAQDEHEAYSAPYDLSLADQIEHSLAQVCSANPNEEERRAKRITELKADLERLEGEQVAA